MSMNIELFAVQVRVCVSRPAVVLLCQAMDLSGEKVLWIDGMNMETPVLLPIASVKGGIEYRGTFRDFLALHLDQAVQVLQAARGGHSPTVLARAVHYMLHDRNLGAHEALTMVVEQARDILDADTGDADVFFKNVAPQGLFVPA